MRSEKEKEMMKVKLTSIASSNKDMNIYDTPHIAYDVIENYAFDYSKYSGCLTTAFHIESETLSWLRGKLTDEQFLRNFKS